VAAGGAAADIDDDLPQPRAEGAGLPERLDLRNELDGHFLHQVVHFDGPRSMGEHDRGNPSPMEVPQLLLRPAITGASSLDEPLLRAVLMGHSCSGRSLTSAPSGKLAIFGATNAPDAQST
jgi:hypothetical protein